MIEHKMSEMKV